MTAGTWGRVKDIPPLEGRVGVALEVLTPPGPHLHAAPAGVGAAAERWKMVVRPRPRQRLRKEGIVYSMLWECVWVACDDILRNGFEAMRRGTKYRGARNMRDS